MSLKTLPQDDSNGQTTTARSISFKACTTQCLGYVSSSTFQRVSEMEENIKLRHGPSNFERKRQKLGGM